jgi:hypothetical protein
VFGGRKAAVNQGILLRPVDQVTRLRNAKMRRSGIAYRLSTNRGHHASSHDHLARSRGPGAGRANSGIGHADHSDTISGHEYYYTSTDGRFAGTASGALPGGWNANVQHTKLCLSCTPTATITGGSVSLATTLHGIPTLVTGKFTGGTVQVINKGANCTNQTFAVHGILASAGPSYSGHGTGTFTATLTHHRTRILGNCVTYGASVKGSLGLTF